jgi:formylmethanofuran dehydrogenase subunit E
VQTAERFPCRRGNGPLRARRGAVRDRLQPSPKNAKAHGLRQNGNDLCEPENGAVRQDSCAGELPGTAKDYALEIEDVYAAQCEAYKVMSDVELFEDTNVEVLLRPEGMPGRPLRRIRCDICGELVKDMRDIYRGGQVQCKPCANGGYYFTK